MAVTIVWPSGLKFKPDMESFRVLEGHPPPLVTEFEDGPNLMRKSRIGERAKLAYRIKYRTPAEFETFRLFVRDDLAHGTAMFKMFVWVPVNQINNDNYEQRTVQIERGLYTAEPWGLGWQVSFTLIVYDW